VIQSRQVCNNCSVPGVEEVALNHFVHWGMEIVVPGSSVQPHRPAIMSQISANYPSMFGLPPREK